MKGPGIDIELDGFPCDKCSEWHSTLYWHDKYDDYLLNRRKRWDEAKKERPNLFKDAVYYDILSALELIECEQQNNCCICGSVTHFMSQITLRSVCSDECKYTDISRYKNVVPNDNHP